MGTQGDAHGSACLSTERRSARACARLAGVERLRGQLHSPAAQGDGQEKTIRRQRVADVYARRSLYYWREQPCKGLRYGGWLQCARNFRIGWNRPTAGGVVVRCETFVLREK